MANQTELHAPEHGWDGMEQRKCRREWVVGIEEPPSVYCLCTRPLSKYIEPLVVWGGDVILICSPMKAEAVE